MSYIYLSTALLPEDFAKFCSSSKSKPNPAGQNFHAKLLDALSLEAKVVQVSFPPFSAATSAEKRISANRIVSYHTPPANKIRRYFLYPGSLAGFLYGKNKDIQGVLFDANNVLAGKVALSLAKKAKVPCVAILTDDPKNITGVSSSYIKQVYGNAKKADAAFALTEGLLRAFEAENKPNLIRPIIVEDKEIMGKSTHPYIYYGGALYEKDGCKRLIEAFMKTDPAFDLLISGHGPYGANIIEAAAKNPRIQFLGQIDKEEHFQRIAEASLCINPRIYRKELDATAVPSKVMEYLRYGNRIASTLSTPIKEAFPEDIYWIEEGEDAINKLFQTYLSDEKSLSLLPENHAKERVKNEFGISETGRVLQRFLSSLSK